MKKILLAISVTLLLILLSGCELLETLEDFNPPISEEKELKTLTISLSEETIELSSFSFDYITLTLHFDDDSTQSIPLSESFIYQEDLYKLSTVGEHEIRVSYQGLETTFMVTLIEDNDDSLEDDTTQDDSDHEKDEENNDNNQEEDKDTEDEIDNGNDQEEDNDNDQEENSDFIDEEDDFIHDTYYFPITVDYDGPRLDEAFFDIIPYEYGNGNPYRGTGGAFYVDYDPENYRGRCIDGDTTVFYYPSSIFEKITANAKSTRYFNIDTPETWSSGEEPFGFLATRYVCDLLLMAEEIVLQTDPGDNFLDRYGRLLAWVWILLPGEDDYQLLNYMIVRQGLGEVKYLFGAGQSAFMSYGGKTYTQWMFQAEDLAIEEELGIFGSRLDYYWDYDLNRPYQSRIEEALKE